MQVLARKVKKRINQMKIKLTNSFHKTEVFAYIPTNERYKTEQNNIFDWICFKASNGDKKYKRLEKRIRKVLCGMEDCSCGIVN